MTIHKIRPYVHARWIAASILSAVCVLTLTHVPNEALPRLLHRNMLDKGEHVAAYGLITLLFLLSLKRSAPPILPIAGLLVLAGIGILDEVTQPLVNRTASMWDYAADLIGMGIACVVFLVRKRWALVKA